MEQKNIHSGHRQRLKAAMLASEFKGISDINLLEAVLFYSIQRADTNETAHRLLEQFGSVKKVFEAHFDDLMNVPGIGEHTAFLIKLVNASAKKINAENPKKATFIKNNAIAAEVFEPYFLGEKDEVMLAMFADNAGRLIRVDVLNKGTVNSVSFDNRKLLEGAIRTNAATVFLAHNHPHGLPNPSKEDLKMTIRAKELLEDIHAKLYDHLIYADGHWYSFRERKDCLVYLSKIVSAVQE